MVFAFFGYFLGHYADGIRSKNRRLLVESQTDPLTGLGNHRYLHEAFHHQYQKRKSDSEPVSCFMMDLDFFKKVNDTYGHPFGEREIPKRQRSGEISAPSVAKTIVEGWRYIGQTRVVRGIVIGMIGAFAAAGVVVGLGQVYVTDTLHGGHAGWGVVFAAIFVGLAVGMFLGLRILRGDQLVLAVRPVDQRSRRSRWR